MNNSQSSDVFSGSGNYSFDDTAAETMDTSTYEDHMANTKELLCKNVKLEVQKSSFPALFSSIINECSSCIHQSLDLVISLITDTEVNLVQLCEYLDNAVNILQLLCGFLTKVIEGASMKCSCMKNFPTITGRIILTVFSHCKDSESLYGSNLKSVERQLKDLFRNCHELQITYLMVLEKNFIFDLTEFEELGILLDALDINLKIGEIVQSLDVKTMAEQWKAYTMICEKYSEYLLDRHIFEDCCKVLSKMIEHNISTAVEVNQEDKIVLRSLKVSSFTIKILLRVCNIFKHAPNKNHEHVAYLLLYIYLNNPVYLECKAQKSAQFINLINTHITTSAEALIKELTLDETFVNHLSNYQWENLEKEEFLVSYILIIISSMKYIMQQSNTKGTKLKQLDCVFQWLPHGHACFNIGLKFKSANISRTYGLYEHLLSITFAMTATFDSEEINYLEKKLIESLLGTECYSALFSSNLWDLLARLSSRQFLFSQVISLCKIYQKLENHNMFAHSPQQIHITQTLRKLFKCLNSEDKMKIYKQFRISEDKNFGLWSVLEIKNSGFEVQRQTEEQIIEKLKTKFHKIFDAESQCPDEIESLVKAIRLTSTCSFLSQDATLEDYVIKAWMVLCPKSNNCPLTKGTLDTGTLWYLDFVEALVSLTTSMLAAFRGSTNLVRILHVASSLIEEGNTELKLVLTNLFLKTSQYSFSDVNKNLVEPLLTKTFSYLMEHSSSCVRNKFWNELRMKKNITNIDKTLTRIFEEKPAIKETWHKLSKLPDYTYLKEHLMSGMCYNFSHKCVEKVENDSVIELSDTVSLAERADSSNFEFADIDTIFETESDPEPASKRVKLDTNEAEQIISRLEKDVSLLNKIKENVTSECKLRIRMLCDKLANIID
ncbi:hypothetical protein NE865_05039 [Phthorimaea operculella]|nr:hypothetical protein NE865_05039 [Phthorimaea operculella]